MQQIIHIHGGECFPDNNSFYEALKACDYNPLVEKKHWRDWLKQRLSSSYQMIIPQMPNGRMASYKARKIWFEKIFSYLNDEWTILTGQSLGAMFLLKYLTENWFPRKIKQLHLLGTLLDEENLPADNNYLGDFLFDTSWIPAITKQIEYIYIYHSRDDEYCPYSHAERLVKLLPNAEFISFEDRWHFSQPEFPELLENIIGYNLLQSI